MTEETKPKVEPDAQPRKGEAEARQGNGVAGTIEPNASSTEPKFEGKSGEPELKGHIFDCGDILNRGWVLKHA